MNLFGGLEESYPLSFNGYQANKAATQLFFQDIRLLAMDEVSILQQCNSGSSHAAQGAVVVQVATGRRALLGRHRERSGAQLFVSIFQQLCQRSLQGLVA